ncbi:hypothetical protein [Nonomuraea ceibae]|uniref:hypothetical protein n=1 Tax=Nonomuraea ceibae TaxID=1935170 RepID=UPI001C60667C|nr:hypothetical protein [Nonomuraea ceibae]
MSRLERMARLVAVWAEIARGRPIDLTGSDLTFIHKNRDLFDDLMQDYLTNRPVHAPGAPSPSPVHAPAQVDMRPVHAPSAPSAPPAVVEAASKADKAGVSADAGYRTLAEWGREYGIRKGSDFWRAVVKERGTR